jgi:AraC-like DNA-binding protein
VHVRAEGNDLGGHDTAPHVALAGGQTVVALVRDGGDRAAIRDALRGVAVVEFCERAADLVRLATEYQARMVIAEPRDAIGRRTAPALRVLRLRRPRLRVVLYVGLTPADVRDAADVSAMRVLIREYDSVDQVLRGALTDPSRTATPGALLAPTAAFTPPSVRRFFTYCAWRADQVHTAREAAANVSISYRTLARRLRAAGLPPAKAVLAWYRLLHAAWQMELGDPTREVVATAAGFPSGAALAEALRRYTQLSWTELHEQIGFSGLLARFEELVRVPASSAAATEQTSGPDPPRRPRHP